jgi:mannosyltransferase OCH1-like enzyme
VACELTAGSLRWLQHYPFFVPVLNNMTEIVRQGDAMRYFLMHKFGGLYLDTDISCLRPAHDMLEGFDIVLQV